MPYLDGKCYAHFWSRLLGVYERIRIDRNERVCHCRPDTSSELARTLYAYEKATGRIDRRDIYKNQINWLSRIQNENGSFSFAFADGTPAYYTIPTRFPNDNGNRQNERDWIDIISRLR